MQNLILLIKKNHWQISFSPYSCDNFSPFWSALWLKFRLLTHLENDVVCHTTATSIVVWSLRFSFSKGRFRAILESCMYRKIGNSLSQPNLTLTMMKYCVWNQLNFNLVRVFEILQLHVYLNLLIYIIYPVQTSHIALWIQYWIHNALRISRNRSWCSETMCLCSVFRETPELKITEEGWD